MTSLLSIIIVNFNGRDYIVNCLRSILDSDYTNIELIVIDNCSTDDSITIAKNTFSNDIRIRFVLNDSNIGFAAANNKGIKYCNGKYIALINVDTVIDDACISKIINLMENDICIGAAQPKLLSLINPKLIDSTGDFLDFFGYSFRRGAEWNEKDQGQYENIEEVFSARGAALFTRKDLVYDIGLFDEDFFMNGEDVDFCWRARLYGKRILYVPEAKIYHMGQGIIAQSAFVSSRLKMFAIRNTKITMIKNYNFYHMIFYVLVPSLIEILTGLFLIESMLHEKGNIVNSITARLVAYKWLIINSRRLMQNRRIIQKSLRRVPDECIMKHMIRTSPLKLISFAHNIAKYGYTQAVKEYFTSGFSGNRKYVRKNC